MAGKLIRFFRHHQGTLSRPYNFVLIFQAKKHGLNAELGSQIVRRWKIVFDVRINKKPTIFCFNRCCSNFDMVMLHPAWVYDMLVNLAMPLLPEYRRPQFLDTVCLNDSHFCWRTIRMSAENSCNLTVYSFREKSHGFGIKGRN